MAQGKYVIDSFVVTPPKGYLVKKTDTVRVYAEIVCKGGKGETCRIVFLRPDGLRPFQTAVVTDHVDLPAKLATLYRPAYEYAWMLEMLTGGDPVTVFLDGINPANNRVVASPSVASVTPPPVPDVNLWLAANPAVASSVSWTDATGNHPYAAWPAKWKAALAAAFAEAWNQTPQTLPDPPVNLAASAFPGTTTMLSGSDAFDLYVAIVAQSLAVEVDGRVSWSLNDYGSLDLMRILGMNYMFWWTSASQAHAVDGDVIPASPVKVYRFILANGIIRATRLETIAALLEWCRRNLLHAYVDPSWTDPILDEYLAFWGYAGAVPVSRMIDGTSANVPGGLDWHHWTTGCPGTSYFLRAVLRAINIPVEVTFLKGGHTTVEFPSEGKFLSHGDDPYSLACKATPSFSAQELFISTATFDAWFGASTTNLESLANTGRRALELGIQYLPDTLLNDRYIDAQSGTSKAASMVYQFFNNVYTVADLDALSLWTRLDQKLAGFKGLPPFRRRLRKPKQKKKPGPPFPRKKKAKTKHKVKSKAKRKTKSKAKRKTHRTRPGRGARRAGKSRP